MIWMTSIDNDNRDGDADDDLPGEIEDDWEGHNDDDYDDDDVDDDGDVDDLPGEVEDDGEGDRFPNTKLCRSHPVVAPSGWIVMMVTQKIPTCHIPIRWDNVSDEKGGNMFGPV